MRELTAAGHENSRANLNGNSFLLHGSPVTLPTLASGLPVSLLEVDAGGRDTGGAAVLGLRHSSFGPGWRNEGFWVGTALLSPRSRVRVGATPPGP